MQTVYQALFENDSVAFNKVRENAGLTPVPEEHLDAWWSEFVTTTDGAPIALSELVVRPYLIDGEPQISASQAEGTFSISAEAGPRGPDRGPNDLVDPVGAKADAVEIFIPARLLTRNGEPFDGRVSFIFAKHPETERWLLIRRSVENIPTGQSVHPPTL
jgi:hypothetical protein